MGNYNLVLDISVYGVYRIFNKFVNYYWTHGRVSIANDAEIIWVASPTPTNTSKFMAAPISFCEIVKYNL